MENEKIIKQAKELSQKTLDRGEEPIPICLAFRKDNAMEIIGVPFKNNKEKEGVRSFLKNHLTKIPLEKYAIIFDAKMTKWNKEDLKKEPEIVDTIIISVYTAQDKITQIFPYYKEKKLIDTEMIEIKGRTKNTDKDKAFDCWDIWGEEVPYSETSEQYNEYKRNHRELYRGLEKEEDEIYDLKKKGKLEVFDMAFGYSMKIYRLDKKVMFEAINGQGKVFLSSKAIDDDEDFKKKLKEVKAMIRMVGEQLDKK